MEELDPRSVCRALLAAMDASEGRRRKRKRDTTPDSIGMGIKRALLEGVVRDGPTGDELEGWLARKCEEMASVGAGAVRAMARDILEEWRMAALAPNFRAWLERGAPSADGED